MKLIRRFFLFLLVVGLLAGAAGTGVLYYEIVIVPAPEMTEKKINEILGQESPVFYRDGTTQFGVLFEDVHRQYIKFEELPPYFVNALLAAEDDQYYHHFGVDVPGVLRAMYANFLAGKVVQGGSTITQQTAKNLFKRESRSIAAKVKELLQALRLEYRFSKDKILEFYCNQFYVSGNGHGIGVAARYFFDKSPSELTLEEAAFIAGSVKRPNYYNPFLQKNLEDPQETKKKAMERVRYVLERMLTEKMITQDQFAKARTSDLKFKQGKMSYNQNATMDLVKEGVSSPVITGFLEDHGISNISTSGVHIITSVDKNLQDKTVFALRSQLSQLDVVLRGYDRLEVQKEYETQTYPGDTEAVSGAFMFGKVTQKSMDGKGEPTITVQLSNGQNGLINKKGLDGLAEPLAIHQKGPWAKVGAADRTALYAQVQEGDRVYVSLMGEKGNEGEILLSLERYPKVEGGAIVLQEGAIRAMSGGMSNFHFNRATSARRLMGSTFKPFVYAAAMQLGWSPVDMLNNRRNVFVFMDRPYFPQPDHNSPFDNVTMSWAGVTSENLASVWLLYHLIDHLEFPAIQEIAEHVDMAPRMDKGQREGYDQYKNRIQSQFGMWISGGMVDQAAFDAAVRNLETDFLFAGKKDEYARLTLLPYGYNFDKYAGIVSANKADAKPAEVSRNLGLLYPSFLGIRARLPQLQAYKEALYRQRPQVDPDLAFSNPSFAAAVSERENIRPETDAGSAVTEGGSLYRTGSGLIVFSSRATVPDGWAYLNPQELLTQLATMGSAREEQFWQEVQLEGVISAGTAAQVEKQMAVELQRLNSKPRYSLEVLSELRDFRVMLGLQYLIQLARACGVESNIEPVLSLPLGSNVITASEMTRVYETLITGHRFNSTVAKDAKPDSNEHDDMADQDGLSLIERIETPDGRIVYERQKHPAPVFNPAISAEVSNILQNVVRYGTGNYAVSHVQLRSDDPEKEKALEKVVRTVPLLGKTGTANDYRNASFFGFVPVLASGDSGVTELAGGYAIGVYTGYDINQPMVQGASRISGARGPLPAWCDIAQAVLDEEHIAEQIDPVDLQFTALGLRYPDAGQVFLPVNPKHGGVVLSDKAPVKQLVAPPFPASLVSGKEENGFFQSSRTFAPFWREK